MAEYNTNRGGNSRFGGKPSFGGDRSRKPAFGKKPWGDSRSSDRPMTLHKATCAECGKMCEVPFRPNGMKPVFCKECFAKQEGGTRGERGNDRGERFPKRDFHAHTEAPRFEPKNDTSAVLKQIEILNVKLDRLSKAVEALASNKTAEKKEAFQDAVSLVVKKIPKKRTAKK